MKIVFGSDSFLPVLQGITTHMVLFAQRLVALGHEVLIVAPEYPGYEEVSLGEGITIQRYKSYSVGDLFKIKHAEDRFVNLFQKTLLDKVLDAFQPDLVHCHTEFAMGRSLLRYAKKRKVPIAMTAHIYFEYYMQFYFSWLPAFMCRFIAKSLQYHFFKHADLLISPTLLMKKNLLLYGVKREAEVISTGMILSDFEIHDPQDLETFKEKNPVFKNDVLLFVGRIVSEKNVEFLLSAFIKLNKQYPDVHLVYVGKGLKQEELVKQAEKAGLSDRVHFFEPVERKNLKYFYHAAKLFTFPSIGETQGLVVLESMCTKTPVIGVDAMGVGETMCHRNYGGLISPPGDMDLYVTNIGKLLDDKQLFEEKSQEAFEIAKAWDIESSVNKLESAYIKLIKDKTPKSNHIN